ncbi:hypothetical protein KY290_025327 [Solanum tuberosum]|uniref:Uncharacterized protein n=1 Tax=Solanum tuberosum TaxID=4113 RepID=A0ABQ7UT81_SOLTU|nr:hypothetical protein KY290_025327 [Solanum tuberosum]
MSSSMRVKGKMTYKMVVGELPRAPHLASEQHDHILDMLNKDPSQHSMMTNMEDTTCISQTPIANI